MKQTIHPRQAGRHAAGLALLALMQLLCAQSATTASEAQPGLVCKPQGLLVLDEPYLKPAMTDKGGLPVCPQFTCSCCRRSHVSAILKTLAPSLAASYLEQVRGRGQRPKESSQNLASTEGGLSNTCAEMTMLMSCRICDPQVGIGIKPRVCMDTCNAWYEACKHDYFTFDGKSNALLACPVSGPGPGSPPCSLLGQMATGGTQMCELAGLDVATSQELCYDGKDPEMAAGMCISVEQRRREARWKARDESKDKTHIPIAAYVMLLIIILLPRVMPKLVAWVKQSPNRSGGRALGRGRPRFARPGG